jgi:hypothetical protein
MEGDQIYELIYIIANFISEIGLLILMFVVEKYIYSKLRFIPSLIILISAILEIIFHEYMFIFTIILLIPSTLIPVIYFRVAFQTIGKARIRGYLHGTGLIIFMLGLLLNTFFMWQISLYFSIIGPLMEFAGVGIFHYALLYYGKPKEKISKNQ